MSAEDFPIEVDRFLRGITMVVAVMEDDVLAGADGRELDLLLAELLPSVGDADRVKLTRVGEAGRAKDAQGELERMTSRDDAARGVMVRLCGRGRPFDEDGEGEGDDIMDAEGGQEAIRLKVTVDASVSVRGSVGPSPLLAPSVVTDIVLVAPDFNTPLSPSGPGLLMTRHCIVCSGCAVSSEPSDQLCLLRL